MSRANGASDQFRALASNCTANDMAALTGLTPQRIGQYVNQFGAPRIDARTYDAFEFIPWVLQFRGSESPEGQEALTYLRNMQAEVQRLKAMEMRRELVPIDEVVTFFAQVCGAFVGAMTALPARVATGADLRKEIDHARELVDAMVEQYLQGYAATLAVSEPETAPAKKKRRVSKKKRAPRKRRA